MIEYYEKLLHNENIIDHPKRIILNILIGKNYFHLKEYDKAFSRYNIALQLLDDPNRLIGDIHIHLGDVWQEINDYESALLCYKQAVQIISKYDAKDKQIPSICSKLADINKKLGHYQDADRYESEADNVKKYYDKLHSPDDRTIIKHHEEQINIKLDSDIVEYAHQLYTTGMHLVRKGDFGPGLENLLQADEIFKNYFWLFDHVVHKLAKLYEHAAYAYLCLNNHLKALVIWRKAIDIRTNFNIN